MIGFILALVILVTFVGLNWENTSDIDLWFSQKLHFEDVSIVMSFLLVYLLGMISSIPFWIDRSIRNKRKEKKQNKKMEPLAGPVHTSVVVAEEESSEETSDS